jgi:membrane protease YdiL (CAAX protease family)
MVPGQVTVSSPSFAARHPFLTTIATTVSLVIALGIAGTALYLSGHTTISPVAVVFPVIALVIVIRFILRRRLPGMLRSGLRAVTPGEYALAVTLPVAVLIVTTCSVGGFPPLSLFSLLGWVLFAALIGFVEEAVYRGWFLSLLLPRGRTVAVLVSSALFAVSHAVNALAGQDVATSVRQVVFAFLFGIVAALLYLLLGNLWVAIAFHTLNDLIQFLGAESTTRLVDIVSMGMLLASIAVLLPLLRRLNSPIGKGTTSRRQLPYAVTFNK